MPHVTAIAVASGVVVEPQAMADARGTLTRVCWVHDGQRIEHADSGFWWMRFGHQSLRIAAPFPAGTNIEIHWE